MKQEAKPLTTLNIKGLETQKEGVKGEGVVRKEAKEDEECVRRETGISGRWQNGVEGSCQGVGRFRGSFQKGAFVFMFNYSAWNDDMVTLNASTVSSFG